MGVAIELAANISRQTDSTMLVLHAASEIVAKLEIKEWPAKAGQTVAHREEVSNNLSTAAYPASKRVFTPWTEKSIAPVIGT